MVGNSNELMEKGSLRLIRREAVLQGIKHGEMQNKEDV
jgi:hypothetical protein